MLVLVSFGLVLLATILLVVGLLTDDGLALIYLSIACSASAAVVLWLAFRKARPQTDTVAEPPTPIVPDGVEPELAAVVAPAPSVSSRDRDATTVQSVIADPAAEDAQLVNPGSTPTADTEAATPGETAGDDWVDDDDWADAGEFEVEFPIADYDELTVDEILPLLPQLYSDELEVVAERERGTKGRTEILDRLAELADSGTEADAGGVPPAPPAPEPLAASAPSRPAPSRPAPQVPSLRDDDWNDDDWDDEAVFPIADYDELTPDQIIPLLGQLEDDELEDVKGREVDGQARKSVISEIDRRLGLAPDDTDAWQAADQEAAPAEAADQDPALADAAPELATAAPAAAAPEPVEPVLPEVGGAEPQGRPAPVAESPEGSMLAIAGYDGLTVAQIRPLLAGLSSSQLRAVLEHEVARDNRRTIVNEIERRLEAGDEPTAPAAAPQSAPARTTAAKKAARAAKKVEARKAPAKKAAGAKKAARTKKVAAPVFPIADYDTLPVAQIRPRLAQLDARQLQQVRERELNGAGRKTILNDIDRRLR